MMEMAKFLISYFILLLYLANYTLEFFLIPSIPLCYDDYFINMTVKHNNLLNPIMGCLYVNFVGLHVSVIHMTIIRSVRAKEIAMQERFPECNGIPLSFTFFSMMDIEL